MDYTKIVVGILFFIGGYILIDTLINIIRIDVEQDVQETILKQSLQKKAVNTIPKPVLQKPSFLNRAWAIIAKYTTLPQSTKTMTLQAGNVYTKNNQNIWKELETLDNTKVAEYAKCNPYNPHLATEIKETVYHNDQMMDVYRNDLVYKYDMDDKITNMDEIDPYDPEIYAAYQNKRMETTKPQPQPTQIISEPILGHSYVSKDTKTNPSPIQYPILSDTHYIPKKIQKINYVPPAIHCDLVPSIDKVLSTNMISDKMLNERVGSYKTMQTNTISNDFISVNEIKYDVTELVPQFNALDNNLYKVADRKPVQSMVYNADDNVCGFDSRYSSYTEIEGNDLRETTGP